MPYIGYHETPHFTMGLGTVGVVFFSSIPGNKSPKPGKVRSIFVGQSRAMLQLYRHDSRIAHRDRRVRPARTVQVQVRTIKAKGEPELGGGW